MRNAPVQTTNEGAADTANSTTINTEIVRLKTPIAPATLAALRERVAMIVADYPDLGRQGFAVQFVSPAEDRSYLLSCELFALEVAKSLQALATHRVAYPSFDRSDVIAKHFNICPAALIVSCAIAGYTIIRIGGQRHAEIVRAKSGRGAK